MSYSGIIRPADSSARFRSLWLRQQQPYSPDGSQVVYQQLLDAYNEPQRVYHSLEHIESCLKIFDQVSELLDNPDAVELAIWFHDVIYKIGDSDNEQLSANLFMTLTNGLFSDQFRNSVYQHIMATRHDCSEITNSDTKLMVDIDLSSFGLPWANFITDSKKVRAEMTHLSDEEYNQKQTSFQLSLLGKPTFYNSNYFHEHYEAQARSNLAKLLELIK
ncbi:MAG: putative metal-dependent HD superfamily phosphohydrolase [Urechidicola sp.]|jgi:predicted metal-dependent HD superfamily phosphohydrolase